MNSFETFSFQVKALTHKLPVENAAQAAHVSTMLRSYPYELIVSVSGQPLRKFKNKECEWNH